MPIIVVIHMQCDNCPKTEEVHQVLSYLPLPDRVPILLDVSEDKDWKVIDDTLFCAECAQSLASLNYVA